MQAFGVAVVHQAGREPRLAILGSQDRVTGGGRSLREDWQLQAVEVADVGPPQQEKVSGGEALQGAALGMRWQRPRLFVSRVSVRGEEPAQLAVRLQLLLDLLRVVLVGQEQGQIADADRDAH